MLFRSVATVSTSVIMYVAVVLCSASAGVASVGTTTVMIAIAGAPPTMLVCTTVRAGVGSAVSWITLPASVLTWASGQVLEGIVHVGPLTVPNLILLTVPANTSLRPKAVFIFDWTLECPMKDMKAEAL